MDSPCARPQAKDPSSGREGTRRSRWTGPTASIHMGLEAVKLDKEGKLIMNAKLPQTAEEKAAVGDKFVFAPDGVHPHVETGHKLYLEAIQRSIPKCRIGTAGPHELKAPFCADHYASARMEPISSAKHSDGFKHLAADAQLQRQMLGAGPRESPCRPPSGRSVATAA